MIHVIESIALLAVALIFTAIWCAVDKWLKKQ